MVSLLVFPFLWTKLLIMANNSDEEHVEEEQLNVGEKVILEKDKKIFINQVDSYHGKHIARVSKFYWVDVDWLKNVSFKFFARVKPGSTNESSEEGGEKIEQLDDEQLYINGWKVFGTIKNTQGYIKPPFIQEIIEVLFKYYSNWLYNHLRFFYSIKIVINWLIIF